MTINKHQAAYLLALALIIGGFGALGAAAGTQIGLAVIASHFKCAAVSPPDACAPALTELKIYTQALFAGGIVSMACGFLALRSIQNP